MVDEREEEIIIAARRFRWPMSFNVSIALLSLDLTRLHFKFSCVRTKERTILASVAS